MSTIQEMTPLLSWDDAMPFAGKVVAYKTTSYYMGSEKGYVLDDLDLKFGYVSCEFGEWYPCGIEVERGYCLTKLLKPKDISGTSVLNGDRCQSISIRLASSKEISSIIQAITSDQAILEYWDKDKSLSVLSQHIKVE